MMLVIVALLVLIEVLLSKLHLVDPFWLEKIEQNKYIPMANAINSSFEFKSLNPAYTPFPDYCTMKFNNLGLRGPDTTIIPSKKRIILLGDSFTQSAFLDEESSLHTKIQSRLEETEVLNAALAAGATDDIISILFHRVIHLQPSLVVLILGINDFGRGSEDFNKRYLHLHEHKKAKSEWRDLWHHFLMALASFHIVKAVILAYQYLSSAHFYHTVWNNGARRTIIDQGVIRKYAKHPKKIFSPECLSYFKKNVEVIIAGLQALNIPVFTCLQPIYLLADGADLTRIPNAEDTKKILTEYYKGVEEVCKNRGVKVCDLRTLPLSAADYFDRCHITAKATEAVSQVIANQIKQM